MKWQWLHLIFAFIAGIACVVLTACSGQPSTVMPMTSTPADVHQQWIAALQAGDHSAALALYEEHPQRKELVDQDVTAMQEHLTPNTLLGNFQRVELQEPALRGRDQVALSIWHFERVTWCYETTLVETPHGWRVTLWGQAGRCPEGVH